MTCTLYKQLALYQKSVEHIKLHCWWNVAKHYPSATRQISSVMSVLMGGQPGGMQHNFKRRSCALCHLAAPDSPTHVLFECPEISGKRTELWGSVTNSMPSALSSDIDNLNNKEKTVFILSGFRGEYIPEWKMTYVCVARFVHEMYKERNVKYTLITEDSKACSQ